MKLFYFMLTFILVTRINLPLRHQFFANHNNNNIKYKILEVIEQFNFIENTLDV